MVSQWILPRTVSLHFKREPLHLSLLRLQSCWFSLQPYVERSANNLRIVSGRLWVSPGQCPVSSDHKACQSHRSDIFLRLTLIMNQINKWFQNTRPKFRANVQVIYLYSCVIPLLFHLIHTIVNSPSLCVSPPTGHCCPQSDHGHPGLSKGMVRPLDRLQLCHGKMFGVFFMPVQLVQRRIKSNLVWKYLREIQSKS